MNLRRSKQPKKVGSPNQESEIGSFRASPIVVSLFSGVRELSTLWMVWGGPYLSFSNLDVRSRFHSYLRNYELRTFNTCVSTYKSRQNSKRGKNKGRNVKWKSKRKLKKKKPVSAFLWQNFLLLPLQFPGGLCERTHSTLEKG